MLSSNKNHVGRTLKLLGNIFAITGTVLLLFSLIFAMRGLIFLSKAESTTATLHRYEQGNDYVNGSSFYYSYEIDGKEYKNIPLSYYSSSDYEGKKVTVYYDPKAPEDVKPMLFLFFGCFFTVPLGSIFFIIGISFILTIRSKERRKKLLLESGLLIQARYMGTSQSQNVRINGSRPFYIECSYKDPYTEQTYLFRSEYLGFNPKSLIQVSEIPVYIDRENFKKYYVDIRQFTDRVVDYR